MLTAINIRNAAYAGILAGMISTVVQLFLWWTFWNVLPEIFYRDVRLTAAIVLGRTILPPPVSFDGFAFLVASLVHFSLSILYSFILALIVARCTLWNSLLLGAVYGWLLYIVNMYGFSHIFPWFEMVRDWITLVTHLAFGVAVAGIYTLLSRHSAQERRAPQ